MSTAVKHVVVASLALGALLVAGCQRGGEGSPGGSHGGTSAPVSTVAVAALKNLVTQETAGKPVLNLKLGEPVSVQKGGITLTITAKSLEKLDGDPPDLSDATTSKENCGVWWKLSDEIVVDAQPNATWKSWTVDFGGFYAFQKGTMGDQYDVVPVGDGGAGEDRFINVTILAEAEREKNPSVPFHKVLESKEYFGMCKDSRGGEPSGLDPLGVEADFNHFQSDESRDKPVARWLR